MDESKQSAKTSPPQEDQHRDSRLVQFGRRHPLMTIAGVAAAGLAGGIEMAAGVLLGAAALALVGRKPPQEQAEHEEHEEHEPSSELQKIKERARAVIAAARGEIGAQAQVH